MYKSGFAWLWGASAVFDTVVFGLTLYRVLTLRKTGLKVPLTTLFLRDGMQFLCYFHPIAHSGTL